ncbi:flavin monoamine oxidase family protein [Alkalicoccus chagannorensis]|uniref:flavin monoamine oxidase family protein n=1 Tax=Alkalicoccus chagannorensis TaxID=427072 RepID=UPI0004789D5F|nr:FAD-dependent oxidoreductase [Alkalicoccus chagannorensis]
MNKPTIIIGAGAAGLYAANQLVEAGKEVHILEARGRTGGRVHSVDGWDLGPTWYWPEQEPLMTDLVQSLGLPVSTQHTHGHILVEQAGGRVQRHQLPAGAASVSHRLQGGMQQLTDALAAPLPENHLHLHTTVTAVTLQVDGVLVETTNGSFEGETVLLALPPRLAAEHIRFHPALPADTAGAMHNRPTWMAGHAKALAVYETPFWQEEGLSGQAMSWRGPLQEIHDASPENGTGAIFGFVGLPQAERQRLSESDIQKLVLEQLENLFGPPAAAPTAFYYYNWTDDPLTAVAADAEPLHDFPVYGPVDMSAAWGTRLLLSGTETDTHGGGHLEGAIRAAERAVHTILEGDT